MGIEGRSSKHALAAGTSHVHLLAAACTELMKHRHASARLLDAGCGRGTLMALLQRILPDRLPNVNIEICGFDVYDYGGLDSSIALSAVDNLRFEFPAIDWASRVRMISTKEAWPFEENSLDLILSNMVLEHVKSLPFLFAETARTLRPGGSSIHVFPLRHAMLEQHLKLPFVHRIQNHDLRCAWITILSGLGLGGYSAHKGAQQSIHEYAEAHADFIGQHTNYASYGEMLRLAKDAGLRCSFRYTAEYYLQRLLRAFGRSGFCHYRPQRSANVDWLAMHLLKYVAIVTMVLEKADAYSSVHRGPEHR